MDKIIEAWKFYANYMYGNMKHLKVQRFPKGHSLYSDAVIKHDGKDYQATFGQIVDESGKVLHYTLERRDTLIPEGTYEYEWYQSPVNGRVPLLKNVPHFSYIEHHIANYPFELKGCTAHGKKIDVKTPMLQQSKYAFQEFLLYLNNELGTITYETLK